MFFEFKRFTRDIHTLRKQHRGQWESDLLFRNTAFVFNLRSTNVYIYLFRMLDKVRDACTVSPVSVSHNSELVRNSASTFIWHIWTNTNNGNKCVQNRQMNRWRTQLMKGSNVNVECISAVHVDLIFVHELFFLVVGFFFLSSSFRIYVAKCTLNFSKCDC